MLNTQITCCPFYTTLFVILITSSSPIKPYFSSPDGPDSDPINRGDAGTLGGRLGGLPEFDREFPGTLALDESGMLPTTLPNPVPTSPRPAEG